jgi:hypothetical protein
VEQRGSVLTLLALALLSGQARADAQVSSSVEGNRTIEVLLSTAPGAPSPERVLAYIQAPVGAPSLEALQTIAPRVRV